MSVYILSGTRTPIGSFLGNLSTIPAPQLAAATIKDNIKKLNLSATQIQEIYMGNVIQTGVGQAPARQAALFSEIPHHIQATTVNKVCGSGLQATIFAAQSILLGNCELAIAGGMENMSLAPHFIPKSRNGFRFGQFECKDSMQWDGLWDVYSDRPMGSCAEECASQYAFTREQQDEFAISSYKRALQSTESGHFKNEITPIEIVNGKEKQIIDKDEEPSKVKFDKIAGLKPAFSQKGTITAANASSINDGAASLILGGESFRNLAQFKIVSYAGYAQHPTWFTTAPVNAMKICLEKAKLQLKDIDLFEINEAFSVVTLACMKDLGLNRDQVNIFGGAAALGHPIGATGARLIVTLMNGLKTQNVKRGMVSLCIGGGEGLAMIIEKI